MTNPAGPASNRPQAQAMLDIARVRSEALIESLQKQRNREADDAANLSAENVALKQVVTSLNAQLETTKSEKESLQLRYDDIRAQLHEAQTKIAEMLERKQKKAGSSKPQQ